MVYIFNQLGLVGNEIIYAKKEMKSDNAWLGIEHNFQVSTSLTCGPHYHVSFLYFAFLHELLFLIKWLTKLNHVILLGKLSSKMFIEMVSWFGLNYSKNGYLNI